MALNVLIVDDSQAMRDIVARVLQLSGVDMETRFDASNGAEALQLLDEKRVDLMLADINMPIMGGEDLVRRMKGRDDLRELPVIIVSSDGTTLRKERLRDLGVLGYLQKPFRPEDLRTEIEHVMTAPRLSERRNMAIISSAATKIFETMCYACVVDVRSAVVDREETPMGVRVRFSGSLQGALEIWVSQAVATSLALSCLGMDCESESNWQSMLRELANMMCGAALTDLVPDADISLQSPVMIESNDVTLEMGQRMELDEGIIWVSLEVRPDHGTRTRN